MPQLELGHHIRRFYGRSMRLEVFEFYLNAGVVIGKTLTYDLFAVAVVIIVCKGKGQLPGFGGNLQAELAVLLNGHIVGL